MVTLQYHTTPTYDDVNFIRCSARALSFDQYGAFPSRVFFGSGQPAVFSYLAIKGSNAKGRINGKGKTIIQTKWGRSIAPAFGPQQKAGSQAASRNDEQNV